MRWTEEEIEKCKTLFKNGKNVKNIAIILNRSEKSIQVKMRNLNFSISECYTKNSKIEKECDECGGNFISYKKENRKYCSSSCSTKNRNRNVKIDYTKTKKANCIICSKEIMIKNNASSKSCKCDECKKAIKKKEKEKIIKTYKVKKERKYVCRRKEKICKHCENKISKYSFKRICDICKLEYYEYYRPSCEFKFNISDYKEKFDFKLIEKYGWYKPTNRGNNLEGISRDHMYSVNDGFKNKIDPKIISHPANCRLIQHNENNIKNSNSIISLIELLERIEKWDK